MKNAQRVERVVINPADLLTIAGKYGKNLRASGNLPRSLGFEGSGTIVRSGGGIMALGSAGKRVAFGLPGASWKEYVVVPAMNCFYLPSACPTATKAAC